MCTQEIYCRLLYGLGWWVSSSSRPFFQGATVEGRLIAVHLRFEWRSNNRSRLWP